MLINNYIKLKKERKSITCAWKFVNIMEEDEKEKAEVDFNVKEDCMKATENNNEISSPLL